MEILRIMWQMMIIGGAIIVIIRDSLWLEQFPCGDS